MIHDIVGKGCMRIIAELVICGFLEEIDLSKKKAKCIEPRKQNTRNDLSNAFFTKTEVVPTNNR